MERVIREFGDGKEAPQIFCLNRAAFVRDKRSSENGKYRLRTLLKCPGDILKWEQVSEANRPEGKPTPRGPQRCFIDGDGRSQNQFFHHER